MFNGVVTSDELRSMLNESEGNKVKYPIDEKDIVYNGHYVLLTFPAEPSKQGPILIGDVDVKVIGLWDRMTGTPKDLFNSIADVAASRKKIISKGKFKGGDTNCWHDCSFTKKEQKEKGLILDTEKIAIELSKDPNKIETEIVKQFKDRVKFLEGLSLEELKSLYNTIESKKYSKKLSSVTTEIARISGGGRTSLRKKR